MSGRESNEFLAWYEKQKSEPFDNRRVLESYCHVDVTVLRQVCHFFKRQFLHIGHIEVFLKCLKIASACNKLLRRKFLKPGTMGLFPTREDTCNKYTKKAMMWLLHVEQTEDVEIKHTRNGRKYRLPELPHLSVDG